MSLNRRYHLYADVLLWTAAVVLIAIAGGKLLPKPKPPPSAPALLSRRISEVEFHATPLDEALKRLAHQAGVRIVIDTPGLDQLVPYWRSPIDIRLHDVELGTVMRLISPNSKIAIEEEAGVIHVMPYAALPRTVRVYDVRDLIDRWLPDPGSPEDPKGQVGPTRQELMDQLVRLVQDLIHPEDWTDNGGTEILKSAGGWMIISGPQPLHREVQELLTDLRHHFLRPTPRQVPQDTPRREAW